MEEILRATGIPRFHQADPGLRRRRPAAEQHGLDAAAFPGFPCIRAGDYQVQPVYAEDLAAQAVAAGCLSENFVADAAGPDTFTFKELLRLLASAVGARVRLVHTPPFLGLAATRLAGLLLRDVVLSRDEVDGLLTGLLTSRSAPTGATRLSDWLQENAYSLGWQYVSELRRNFGRVRWPPYWD